MCLKKSIKHLSTRSIQSMETVKRQKKALFHDLVILFTPIQPAFITHLYLYSLLYNHRIHPPSRFPSSIHHLLDINTHIL